MMAGEQDRVAALEADAAALRVALLSLMASARPFADVQQRLGAWRLSRFDGVYERADGIRRNRSPESLRGVQAGDAVRHLRWMMDHAAAVAARTDAGRG